MEEILIKETAADTNYVSVVSTERAACHESGLRAVGRRTVASSGTDPLARFLTFVPKQIGGYLIDQGEPRHVLL